LDQRTAGDEAAPSYLDLAVHVVSLQRQLDDLATMLVHYARRYEGDDLERGRPRVLDQPADGVQAVRGGER
jgi:hypothetical protein